MAWDFYSQVARKKRIRFWRMMLHLILGDECALCGAHADLEVDHVHGRDWHPRDVSIECRMKRYVVEHMMGVELRMLCARCNGRLGGRAPWRRAAPHERRVDSNQQAA